MSFWWEITSTDLGPFVYLILFLKDIGHPILVKRTTKGTNSYKACYSSYKASYSSYKACYSFHKACYSSHKACYSSYNACFFPTKHAIPPTKRDFFLETSDEIITYDKKHQADNVEVITCGISVPLAKMWVKFINGKKPFLFSSGDSQTLVNKVSFGWEITSKNLGPFVYLILLLWDKSPGFVSTSIEIETQSFILKLDPTPVCWHGFAWVSI